MGSMFGRGGEYCVRNGGNIVLDKVRHIFIFITALV